MQQEPHTISYETSCSSPSLENKNILNLTLIKPPGLTSHLQDIQGIEDYWGCSQPYWEKVKVTWFSQQQMPLKKEREVELLKIRKDLKDVNQI